MANTILGLFEDENDVGEMVNRLQDKGYNPKDISIVMKGAGEKYQEGMGIGAGALSGAGAGAVIGGLAGFLAGTIVPGIGGLLIGGPIGALLGLTGVAASTVSGVATGAVTGGLIGAIISFGVDEEDAAHYEQRVKEGAILVVVPTIPGKDEQVLSIFDEYGAADVMVVSEEEEEHKEHGNEELARASYGEYQFAPVGAKG
ncbi:MAG: general stress protein, partial [Candidatus Levyibacteriota bacterium]